MNTYLAWWFAGGSVGILAGLLVLRHRGALTVGAPLVYLAATLGCLYGAKLQYRLRFFPIIDAIAISPSELLTPGLHIPLGLVFALFAAMLACLILRVPALQMADALAMTGAVMMPIARVGCILVGCCLGTVCPAWLAPMCVRGDAGGLLHQHDAVPLLVGSLPSAPPVHALPVYFGLLGLVTVAVHVCLLRRGAAPGTLLLVGALVYPLGHLGIEQLRDAASDHVRVMTTVLVSTIILDAGVLAIALIRRRRTRRSVTMGSGPRHSRALRVVQWVVAATLALCPRAGQAQCHDNFFFEDTAYRVIAAMGGIHSMPPGVPACPAPLSCNGDGDPHHGVAYIYADCPAVGFGRYTVCISGGLSTADAHRGSDFLHEAMHLYLQRLEEAGVLVWYRLAHPGKDIAACNEYLTDYLTKQYAAPRLHYVFDRNAPSRSPGCGYSGADLEAIAQQLIADKSPMNMPSWR